MILLKNLSIDEYNWSFFSPLYQFSPYFSMAQNTYLIRNFMCWKIFWDPHMEGMPKNAVLNFLEDTTHVSPKKNNIYAFFAILLVVKEFFLEKNGFCFLH